MSGLKDVQIPTGWALTTLDHIAVWGSGGTPKSGTPHFYNGDIPWVIIGDLNDGTVTSTTNSITEAGLANSAAKWVPEDAVLIAMYGSIGKLGITKKPVTTNQAIAFAVPNNTVISTQYLFLYLLSQRDSLIQAGRGGTQQNISQTILKSWPILIPPLAEQHRITEALEGHLSRLDSTSRSLTHAQALIPLQRRALHTAATEGRLTVAPDVDIVPDFLAKRRKSWTSTHSNKKYKEPTEPNPESLPVKPEGWKVFSLEALTDPTRIIRYGILMPRVKSGGRVPYVEVKDLKGCSLHGKQLHLTSDELDEQFAGARIAPGDVLLAVRGSYDRSAVVPPGLRGANVSRDVARIAPLSGIDPEYLHLYLQSDFTQRYLRAHARGVAVKGVNIASIRALPVAIPSFTTQRRIVEEVQQQLTVIDTAEKAVRLSSRRSVALRRALLSRAFNGRLVEQDPTFEPASVLLDRIRAQHEAQGRKNKPKRVARGSRKVAATTDAPPPPSSLTTAIQQELPL